MGPRQGSGPGTGRNPELRSFRLPPGRHGLDPAEVAASQRWRLLAAAAETVAERGLRRTTIAAIARRAAVSSSTFYRHFASLDRCLLAVYEVAAQSLCDLVAAACARRGEHRPRAAIEAALEFLVAEPALGCLLGPELPAGVAAISPARARLLGELAELLYGPGSAGAKGSGPSGDERWPVLATLALVGDRLAGGGPEALAGLGPELGEVLEALA